MVIKSAKLIFIHKKTDLNVIFQNNSPFPVGTSQTDPKISDIADLATQTTKYDA